MASTKISDMTAATVLTDATIPIVQGGVNKKAAISLFGSSGYLVYTALLSQTGTSAPVATVLQNTLGGTVVWTRNSAGNYAATLAGVFTENKTIAPPFPCSTIHDPVMMIITTDGSSPLGYYEIIWNSVDDFNLFVYSSLSPFTFADLSSFIPSSSGKILVEIRVYL